MLWVGIVLAGFTAGPASAASPGPGSAGPTGLVEWLGPLMLITGPICLVLILWRRWYSLSGAPAGITMPPTDGMLLFIVLFTTGLAGAWAARLSLDLNAEAGIDEMTLAQHTIVLGGHALGQLVGVLVYWRLTRGPRPGQVSAKRAAGVGALAFVLVWPMVVSTSVVAGEIARLLREEPVGEIAHQTLQQLADSEPDGWFALMGVLVVLVLPALEEVMYRGVVQRTLVSLNLGRWPAICITSVLFAFMHVGAAEMHALPSLFVLSVGFGWAAERTGSLAAPIVMHVLFNAVNLGLATVG